MPKKMEIMRYICYIISLVSLKKFYKIYFIKVDRNFARYDLLILIFDQKLDISLELNKATAHEP